MLQSFYYFQQVGTWWYRSIRFSGEQVLLNTTQAYFYFCHKTPSMPLKRALMILAASCEFDRRHNSEVIERITDNEEVPAVCLHYASYILCISWDPMCQNILLNKNHSLG